MDYLNEIAAGITTAYLLSNRTITDEKAKEITNQIFSSKRFEKPNFPNTSNSTTMFTNSVGQIMESTFPSPSASTILNSGSTNAPSSLLAGLNNQSPQMTLPCLPPNNGQTNTNQPNNQSSFEHLINNETQVLNNSIPPSLATNVSTLQATKTSLIGWDKHSEKKGIFFFS